MSRGLGKMQRLILSTLLQEAQPITFAELCGAPVATLHPAAIRSARRALAAMVKDGAVIAVGSGGRASPFRYVLHPRIKAAAQANTTERPVG
jgi:hypothetical protein